MSLEGACVVVTGGGRGLGREYAELFARDGARVAIVDLDEASLEASLAALEEISSGHLAVSADVSDRASTESMAKEVESAFGRIDVLVNNAALWGQLEHTPILETDEAYFDRVLSVNLKGPFLCVRAVASIMKRQGRGRIINISSMGAYLPGGMYSLSKAALNHLNWQLAKELGTFGITVNAVGPGAIWNEATRAQVPEEAFQMLIAQNAIQRPGEARDIFGMLRYLASDEAEWVTGQTFLVNGGFNAHF